MLYKKPYGKGMEHSANIEHEHVHKVYSQIADHFSDTRFKPWPRIAQFLNEQPTASLIADVGCGNGKYLGVNHSTYCLGSDICPELVTIAGDRGHEVAVCDCLQLPYKTGVFDAVICIAVIHHLSIEERRLLALREMARILRRGGHMLVYVWAMEQDKRKFEAQDVMVPWHLQPKYSKGTSQIKSAPSTQRGPKDVEKIREKKRLKKERKKQQKKRSFSGNASDCSEPTLKEGASATGDGCLLGELSALDLSDEDFNHPKSEIATVEITAIKLESRTQHFMDSTEASHSTTDNAPNKGGIVFDTALKRSSPTADSAQRLEEIGYQTFQRYYHVFRQGELLELFSKLDSVEVTEEFFDHENWCIIGKKL